MKKVSLIQSLLDAGLTKVDVERRLAELMWGHVLALQSQPRVGDGLDVLFNATNYQAVLHNRLHKDLRLAFEWGMEIRDVARLAPSALSENFDAITALVQTFLTKKRANSRTKSAA